MRGGHDLKVVVGGRKLSFCRVCHSDGEEDGSTLSSTPSSSSSTFAVKTTAATKTKELSSSSSSALLLNDPNGEKGKDIKQSFGLLFYALATSAQLFLPLSSSS